MLKSGKLLPWKLNHKQALYVNPLVVSKKQADLDEKNKNLQSHFFLSSCAENYTFSNCSKQKTSE